MLHLTLNNLPWYNWSIKNRKLLQIVMINTQHALTIKTFGSIKVNNEIITKSYQAVYTLIAFFCTVTRN
ncbi:uncharacterized protein LOC108908829 [Anoplophora glabripennis]|uniref:uncharacterized protein LOC108908829 n=1 Tax=Anoplophora glabripennis TaxID=217634 RepID=UPI000873EE18|nr:uncharacterized protein LOC108908829 [Anoplophora glabripennis]